jgi:hypothetical protein
VLLAQADRGRHAALSRSIALRVVIIFRMTATMMTLDFLSAAARRLSRKYRQMDQGDQVRGHQTGMM